MSLFVRQASIALLLVTSVLVMPLAISGNLAGAMPIFTGDAPTDFVGPAVVRIDDPSSGVGIPDVGMPDQYPSDQISGWEMNATYFEYDSSADTMFVGIDCFGICGDADGDGDPSNTGEILDLLQGTDQPDFSGTESFTVLFDTNNDCDTNPNSAFEVVVGVAFGADLSALGAYNFVGSPFSPSTGFGAQLDNQVTLFASPSADAPDLEFSIANFSTLPGFDVDTNPQLQFQANVFLGSLDDDGIGEDYLPGAASCIPIVPPPAETPTNTPTETPTEVPTETPTEIPTETPTSTPTATPTETPTEVPTETPTEAPTETPTEAPTETPTEAPTETPTSTATSTATSVETSVPNEPVTPMPPPTDLPSTGPGAQDIYDSSSPFYVGEPISFYPRQVSSFRSETNSDQVDDTNAIGLPSVVQYDGVYPQRLTIGAIELDTEISPMSWFYVTDHLGNQVPKWSVTDYAAGWHINSAQPGEQGNVVLSGHNTIAGSVFRELDSLQAGDLISLWGADEAEHRYIVDTIRIVPEEQIDPLQAESNAKWITDFGDNRLTMVSCWPDDSSKYRIIVVAKEEPEVYSFGLPWLNILLPTYPQSE